MSYDLIVWEGDAPVSDEAARAVFVRLMERAEEDTAAEPTAAIRAYVHALLQRWPDITEDAGEDSPWADGPLVNNASGDAIHFSLVWSAAEEASAYAARVAGEHGLVCYDPQLEALRTPPARGGGARRRWFRR
ncbi:hypothetical protein [Nocardioides sp. zg-DK7169]|uniref:hypothetical protein n=1 Tax=Nocardioides sp. zg-DK7169 TaxID=2736600 RepID=UPI001557C0E2|nr:hypothetical protein [Nocardioides sp. zg-DK7169]NPC95976.1 hypothetical protein [Nocardioides sp. zg-DK7169]